MVKRMGEVQNMRSRLDVVWRRRAQMEAALNSRNASRGGQRFKSVNNQPTYGANAPVNDAK
jgi:hypothetical protein